MKTTKTLAYGLTLLMVATFVVAIAPTASAQATEQVITVVTKGVPTIQTGASTLNNNRIAPDTGVAVVKYEFTVTVPPVGACPLSAINVVFTADKGASPPDWAEEAQIVLSGPTAAINYDPQKSGTAQTFSVDTTLSIRITKNAPAGKSGEYRVLAQAFPPAAAAGGCNLKKSDPPTPNAFNAVSNDYLAVMEYTPEKYIQKVGQNKEVSFVVKMTNYGNAATRIETTTDTPEGLAAPVPPAAITLESKAESGEKAVYFKDAVISLKTPSSNGYTNSLYSFTAHFTAKAATMTGQGLDDDEQPITFSLQVQGVYVPGFDPRSAIASLGIGLVLLGFARRRTGQ